MARPQPVRRREETRTGIGVAAGRRPCRRVCLLHQPRSIGVTSTFARSRPRSKCRSGPLLRWECAGSVQLPFAVRSEGDRMGSSDCRHSPGFSRWLRGCVITLSGGNRASGPTQKMSMPRWVGITRTRPRVPCARIPCFDPPARNRWRCERESKVSGLCSEAAPRRGIRVHFAHRRNGVRHISNRIDP